MVVWKPRTKVKTYGIKFLQESLSFGYKTEFKSDANPGLAVSLTLLRTTGPWGVVYYSIQGGSNFLSVGKILQYEHANESYGAVLSCGPVYHVVSCTTWFITLYLLDDRIL